MPQNPKNLIRITPPPTQNKVVIVLDEELKSYHFPACLSSQNFIQNRRGVQLAETLGETFRPT